MRSASDSLPGRLPVTSTGSGAAPSPHPAVMLLRGRPHLRVDAVADLRVLESPGGYTYIDGDGRALFCLHTCRRLATILDGAVAAAVGVPPGEAIPRLSESTMCAIPAAVTDTFRPLAVLVVVALSERRGTLHPSTAPATVRQVWDMLDRACDVGSVRRSLRELLAEGHVTVQDRRWRLASDADAGSQP